MVLSKMMFGLICLVMVIVWLFFNVISVFIFFFLRILLIKFKELGELLIINIVYINVI